MIAVRTRLGGKARAVGISTGSVGPAEPRALRAEAASARAWALRAPSSRPTSTLAPKAAANAGVISPNRDVIATPAAGDLAAASAGAAVARGAGSAGATTADRAYASGPDGSSASTRSESGKAIRIVGLRSSAGCRAVANRAIPVIEPSMQRVPALTSALALAVAAVACAPAAPPRFPARPPGCALETFQVLPQRPFIEIETFHVPSPESLREVLIRIQEPACQDGADAIYAPKAGKAYLYAIALKWKDAPPPPAPPPAR